MSLFVTTEYGRFDKASGTPAGWLFECPGCGEWLPLTTRMMGGSESVNHASQGCPGGYHQTHPYGPALAARMQARALMGESTIDPPAPAEDIEEERTRALDRLRAVIGSWPDSEGRALLISLDEALSADDGGLVQSLLERLRVLSAARVGGKGGQP
jgi:hypothetical protein